MNWIDLHTATQLNEIRQNSANRPQVIFKHSTRCSISQMVKNRLDRSEAAPAIDFYFLDLLAFRPISNSVAETFRVDHESPQILVIRNGECIYDESHTGINMEDILEKSGQN
jgi:bacillithiol system protein YtxJ